MTVNHHLEELYGLPAFSFPAVGEALELPEPETVAWRIGVDVDEPEEEWLEAFARFTEAVDLSRVRALIVGSWQDAYEESSKEIVEALVAARDRLPALRALFLGDMTYEESEISWITQSDVTPLLASFPGLRWFGVRGGSGLAFPPVRHEQLETLVVETGGLGAEVVRGVAACDFPALEHLDLWLGSDWYGGDAEPADLQPILDGTRLPSLRYLALRNSVVQDRIAEALAGAPVVARLEVLDLSMGTLSDEGAAALLAGQPLTHLRKLDLHHHFVGEELRTRLRETLEPAGVELDLEEGGAESDEDEDGVRRYIAVAE
ncbi:STM4015 family protein [Streptomyces sp. UH6]|uniref:STM4015 family protein n=1 Tax=Streptomyces sp. UH6 TaxID=2748379 RepID=UPI0015D504D4|nr:STM4015 family protein [Streptomyces sp. UH6]NYV75499.1 STM4015 family protein [Streptomyces sp. UH6]